MNLSQRAVSTENNKKEPSKIMLYRLKSNHLESKSNEIDHNIIHVK